MVKTGAFSTVPAERTVTVETAGDSGAFLRLQPAQDRTGTQYPNADDYARINDDGLLELTIPAVNLNAITHLYKMFQVTNNGTQPVVLYIEALPNDADGRNAIDIGTLTGQLADTASRDGQTRGSNADGNDGIADPDVVVVSCPASPDDYPGPDSGYSNTGVLIGVGETLELGVYIGGSDDNLDTGVDESGSSDVDAGETLLSNIAVYASAAAAEADEYQFVETNSSP